MKSQKLNRDKNVIKKKKIINGINYYDFKINEDNYTINITNMPKENLIKFKLYLSHENELNISSKDSYTNYENVFSLDYFLNQTQFLSEININNTIVHAFSHIRGSLFILLFQLRLHN